MNKLKIALLEKELKYYEEKKETFMFAPECNKTFINSCDKKIKGLKLKLKLGVV